MIHSIIIDHNIEERLKEFQDRLPDGHKVVSFRPSGNYLFVHTEAVAQERPKDRHLLLEEFDPQKARERFNRG